jgi:DNA polymerase III subunit epsilon
MLPPAEVGTRRPRCKRCCGPSGGGRISCAVTLAQPLATMEFVAVDTETNGRAGEACELTEVGAVLVGGGELHDRFSSLVATRERLGRAIQRFTGITQAMVDDAPAPADVLPRLAALLRGRTMVAHSAAFDRRVLRAAFARAGVEWPNPPVLCTVALARRLAPLQNQRALAPLAAALGIDVEIVHRALPDAETCARVFCALWPKLRAHAQTVEDALVLTRARRRPARRAAAAVRARGDAGVDVSHLPNEPGVYLFRDARGSVLYVGKSVSLRTRARSHFTAADGELPGWTGHAESVDFEVTASELCALVLENRLIKRERPPGNAALKRDDRFAYLRCRLDIAYPILEVAHEPAPGHAVNVGPLAGTRATGELVEQLNSLFELRHCGRRLRRRSWPSAYGQMGRCLSPCLGDLDPNAYRRRLDAALGLFTGPGEGGAALIAHVEEQMRAAAAEQRYERAAWLRRRHERLETLLGRLGGVLRATHARSRLVLAPHPHGGRRWDALWLVGGRVADWGALPRPAELRRRTRAALQRAPETRPGAPGDGAFVPPAEVDEVRIVAGWLAAHDDVPVLELGSGDEELPDVGAFVRRYAATAAHGAHSPTTGKWAKLAR